VNGLFHYLLGVLDPMTNAGFSRAVPQLMASALISWWIIIVLPFAIWVLPAVTCWLIYLVKPGLIRPPLPARTAQAEPLVSIVIAGRNESASIGQCIRAALLCGYSNLEVLFVDDHSDDHTVAVARRAALSVTRNRRDADRVRIFPSPRRNGKASSLNIGIRMARGEFIAIIDADSIIQYGAIQHWLLPFSDPRVGAVSANIRVHNSTASLLTRLQEIEYAHRATVSRCALAPIGLLVIIPGMGGMFRAEILHRLGGYDTGLGDDTDMTMMLRKQRWKLAFSLDAVVWTIVPVTRDHLWRQRMRWQRNIVKIRFSKHRNFFVLGRYGLANAVLALQLVYIRLAVWAAAVGLLALALGSGPLASPELLTDIYLIYLIYLLIKSLIGRDYSRTPQLVHFWLLFLYPFYLIFLRFPKMYAEFCELFRVGSRHPYVPEHVWAEAPWW
jgi:cellulose synthase/poly-beta-1,6-N-acetylglucosamine synthase-like glycosyltransferase